MKIDNPTHTLHYLYQKRVNRLFLLAVFAYPYISLWFWFPPAHVLHVHATVLVAAIAIAVISLLLFALVTAIYYAVWPQD